MNATAGGLVLIPGRDPLDRAGGSESYVTGHARTAALAGWTPHLISMGRRSEQVPFAGGVLHRVRSPVRPVRSINAELHRPWAVRAIVALLAERPGPHLLHAFGAWSGVAVAARRALAARGVASVVVATSYTPIEHEAAAKLESSVVRGSRRLRIAGEVELAWVRAATVPWERRAYAAADEVWVNYESVRELLVAAYGPGLAIRRLTYAAGTAFDDDPAPGPPATPLALPPGDAPLVLSVSRHDGRKGLDVLLRALAVLRDEGVPIRACVAGTGTLLEAHRALVAELGLAGQVTLPGRIAEVMPYLRACDLFVLPSTQEASGSVAVLEALQAGATVVSSAVDGMPEDLTHEQDALLVTPGSVGELAAALRRLAADPALRARLGAGARATYERRFSPAVAAAELGAAYRELLDGAR